jgi:hypothetical protein
MGDLKVDDKMDDKIDGSTVLLRVLMEFFGVMFQLICFSRLGANDYYYMSDNANTIATIVTVNNETNSTINIIQTTNGGYTNSKEPSLAANLVLLVTLVVFQFPFLNAYILFMYDTCVIARTSFKRVSLCVLLTGVQLGAVWLACLFITGVQRAQKPWKGTITWMAPNKMQTHSDSKTLVDADRDLGVEFLEEFVAVTALLVGYIHLVYLNFEADKEVGAKLFRSEKHLFSTIASGIYKMPIPITFILQVTLLVAGLLRAFPSAHLSPHISLYIALMGYSSWGAFGWCIFGAIAAFMVTYIMFWLLYVWRMEVQDQVPL